MIRRNCGFILFRRPDRLRGSILNGLNLRGVDPQENLHA
jgi:hypothetical protein